MKTLYFDCSSGISGNMVLGALIELIDDEDYLIKELKKVNVDGYKIEISKKEKNGIVGTYVDVIVDGKDEYGNHHHLHNHHHHHEHRNLFDVNKIIDDSKLDSKVKKLAKDIFLKVAKAESKVHNKSLEDVHFHEVGAIDSIIDIIGTSILINKINPDKIISSVVNDGYGFIECAHGKMSVPVPATSEIFASYNVKFRQIDIDTELVTPTGAAIIATLTDKFINMPVMNVEKIGWGAGYKDIKIPNLLKVYLGNIEDDIKNIVVMETNIDDTNSEILGYTLEQLLLNGANDVFYTPIFMKKNRPAYKLTVICKEELISKLQNIIFKETTTIGIRYRYEMRNELERQVKELDTKYGKIKVKEVKTDSDTFLYPEYESIKEIAIKNNIPIKNLYNIEELK